MSGGSTRDHDEVEALTSFGPRRAGSEPERQAARHLEQRLEAIGRNASVEPTRIRPNIALTHLIHAVAGVVASVLSVYVPVAGFALALVTTLSAFGDLTGSFQLLRLLTPARASQNVVSHEDNGKPGLILLTAHYDVPPAGLLSNRRLAFWPKALFGSLVVITVCSAIRLLGIDATWFTLIQFIPTVVLIALTPVFADTAIAGAQDDPADNATGVAAVLRVAESHAGLTHFDVALLFTGGSAQFGLGMQVWLKRNRHELEPAATAVISLDNIAAGDAAIAVKEGAVFAARMHPALVELARECGAESFTSDEVSDAYVARAAGLPALRISTTGADPQPEGVSVDELTAALLDKIDTEIGPLLDRD
jgi:acetylornithine deacetylase/succinyl-diaminopimelate desuccinylase-like protein